MSKLLCLHFTLKKILTVSTDQYFQNQSQQQIWSTCSLIIFPLDGTIIVVKFTAIKLKTYHVFLLIGNLSSDMAQKIYYFKVDACVDQIWSGGGGFPQTLYFSAKQKKSKFIFIIKKGKLMKSN